MPVSEARSKEIATRQLLSFLSVTDEEQDANGRRRAPSKKLFSLSRIPDDAKLDASPLLKWQTREIYDVDGALLFLDQILDLGGDNRIEVRTAANDLLRTPVWSVRAGETLGVGAAINKALETINDRRTQLLRMLRHSREASLRTVETLTEKIDRRSRHQIIWGPDGPD